MIYWRHVSGLAAASIIAVLLWAHQASAQSWPTRPLTMVVPFAAGSASDTVARILGARLSEVLGQQVIIENVAGAGGMTGVARVAKAAPDGYQFVLGGIDTFAQNQTLYKKPLYNSSTDFAPVALMVEQPLVQQHEGNRRHDPQSLAAPAKSCERARAGPQRIRFLFLERLFRPQGHARGGRRAAARRRCRDIGYSVRAGAAEGCRRHCRDPGAPVSGLSQDLRRGGDREVGGHDQDKRRKPGLGIRLPNR